MNPEHDDGAPRAGRAVTHPTPAPDPMAGVLDPTGQARMQSVPDLADMTDVQLASWVQEHDTAIHRALAVPGPLTREIEDQIAVVAVARIELRRRRDRVPVGLWAP